MRIALCVMLVACGGDGGAPVEPDGAVGDDAPPDAPVDDRPYTLTEVGRISLPTPVKLVISDGRLYAKLDSTEVLVIFDLVDPAAPARLGGFDPPPAISGADARLAVSGNLAVLAHESDGALLVDVSDPTTPVLVSQFTSNTYPKDVALAGGKIFIADQDSGLVIADVSNPAMPMQVGAVPTDGPFGVVVAGDRAYLADNDAGLAIVDLSTPTAPQVIGTEPSIGNTRSVAVRGDTVYALGEAGVGNAVYAIDVSTPATPLVQGNYPTASEDALVADGSHLLVCGTSGLEVLSMGATPVLVTSVPLTAPRPKSAVASATHVYVATQGAAGELITFAKVFE